MDDHKVTNVTGAGSFKPRAFGKDVLVYSAGNGLALLFGVFQFLIIPRYLSVESYGYWQLFLLYALYVSILQIGFSEGVLVRWAGKELSQVGSEIKTALRFLVLEQLAVVLPLGLITYFLLQPPIQWLGLMILSFAFIWNLANLLLFTTQAIRQFRVLAALEAGRGFFFLAVIVLLFASGHFDYQYVIVVYVASYMLFMVALAVRYRRYLWGNCSPAPSMASFGKTNIDTGIFILFGNFVYLIFWSLDRLLVSSFFPIEQFAVYAFAMSVTQIALIFSKVVADVLFPHLSAAIPEQRTGAYQVGKLTLILCWAIFLGAYFPLAALIKFYLPHYTGSLPIIKILLGTVGFSSLILILHVNYYRLYRKQRQYFLWGITALALAVVLALIAIKILGTLESVAIAILISFCVWYIINGLSLKAVTGESSRKIWKDLIIIGCYLAGFWLALFLSDWLIAQMLIYIGFLLVISFGFFGADLKYLMAVMSGNRNKGS